MGLWVWWDDGWGSGWDKVKWGEVRNGVVCEVRWGEILWCEERGSGWGEERGSGWGEEWGEEWGSGRGQWWGYGWGGEWVREE